MKTYKQFVAEVAEPRGEDEKKFKKRHTDATDKKDYPIGGQEHVFKGKDKAPARTGDAQNQEDMYDDQYVDDDDEGEIKGPVKKRVKEMKRFRVEEEVVIVEAIKAGTIKLKDGSTQKIAKEDASTLNKLFSQLNGNNKKQMEERMTKSTNGYSEVLQFAKNL